jgi:hypothetical protein
MKQIGNPIMQGSTGTLGEVVFKQVRGRLVIGKRPKRRTSFTEKQERVKDKFREAVYYAKGQVADAAARAEYTAGMQRPVQSIQRVSVKQSPLCTM